MVEVTFLPVTEGDIAELVANMRQQDRDELDAAGADDPEQAVVYSCAGSRFCWTARFDGKLACVFGVGTVSHLAGIGAPWLLGTDEIRRHQRAFIKHSRPYIEKMLKVYPELYNMVDARNSRAIRWLKRMGFSLAEAQPLGPKNMPFHPFKMEA